MDPNRDEPSRGSLAKVFLDLLGRLLTPKRPVQFCLRTLLWFTAAVALIQGLLILPDRTHLWLVLGGFAGGALYVTILGYLGIGDGWRGVFRLFK